MSLDARNVACVIPALTWVPDTIRRLINEPGFLAGKSAIARSLILRLHDTDRVIAHLIKAYGWAADAR